MQGVAFDRNRLYERALRVAKDKKCYFVEQVATFSGCSKTTLYELFPNGSAEMNAIKDILADNRVATKTSMYSKWHDSDNATLQVSLMKLIGNEEDRKKLSQSHVDVTSKDNELKPPQSVNIGRLPTDVLEAIIKASENKEES